jgi:hypothetical protein
MRSFDLINVDNVLLCDGHVLEVNVVNMVDVVIEVMCMCWFEMDWLWIDYWFGISLIVKAKWSDGNNVVRHGVTIETPDQRFYGDIMPYASYW